MNERIKELLIESKFPLYELYGREMDKFAELIVKECAELIRQDSGPDDNYNAGRNMTIDMMAELIEKHFGVEE